MKITTEPRSDQWNAEDFIGGPKTFTVAGVKAGSAEQKYDIELGEGEGRVWRPPLTVLRLLVSGWGDDATAWVGRRVRLYRDPTITFGRDQVGGIRLSHMSHIAEPVQENLTVTRGRRTRYVVEPLIEDASAVAPAERSLPERIDSAVAAYARASVTVPMLEARVARPRDEWDEQNVADLEALFQRLRARETTKEAEFSTGVDA